MNRILVAAASTLLLTGAALAQQTVAGEPWAPSIQTEGSPSNGEIYGSSTSPAAFSFGGASFEQVDNRSVSSTGTSAPSGTPSSAELTLGQAGSHVLR